MRTDLVLAMYAYIPEQTVRLTEYYRALLNIVNGIISYMCIKQ